MKPASSRGPMHEALIAALNHGLQTLDVPIPGTRPLPGRWTKNCSCLFVDCQGGWSAPEPRPGRGPDPCRPRLVSPATGQERRRGRAGQR